MKLLLILALAVTACQGKSTPAAGGNNGVYEVDGVVAAVPGDLDAMLHISHEDIPDFVGRDGMPAMTMPFAVGEGVKVSGLAKGDKVHFTFEVNWNAKSPLTVTKITKVD
jgi:Cu/Ag efflux protein CusF